MSKSKFVKELECLINRCSLENGSDTPDFILAEYLVGCLEIFDQTSRARDSWHGFMPFRREASISGVDAGERGTEAGRILKLSGEVAALRKLCGEAAQAIECVSQYPDELSGMKFRLNRAAWPNGSPASAEDGGRCEKKETL